MFTATDLARLNFTPDQIAAERRAWKHVRKLSRDEWKARTKAYDLVDLNRRALDHELAAAPPDPSDPPVEEISLDNLAAAVDAKASILYPVPASPEDEKASDERPLFMTELEHYEWILNRTRRGLDVDEWDKEWAAEFETTPLYRDLGGDDYRGGHAQGSAAGTSR